jgi:hypothetical protein
MVTGERGFTFFLGGAAPKTPSFLQSAAQTYYGLLWLTVLRFIMAYYGLSYYGLLITRYKYQQVP